MITDALFKEQNETIPESIYPESIIPVPKERIKGRAFFPGGDGLFKSKTIPEGGIMILGQDFDNEDNFKISIKYQSENKKPNGNRTWSNLEKIFSEKEMQNSFFTNAIMGLRERDSTNTGRSKAFLKKNKPFLDECRKFFSKQVKTQKPKLIIGLGSHIPKFLSECTDEFKDLLNKSRDLSKITSLKKLGSTYEENIFTDVIFKDTDNYKSGVIFITHPSMYFANVKRRNPKGADFESELIRKAIDQFVVIDKRIINEK